MIAPSTTLALSFGQAKAIALVVVIVLVLGALAWAWLVKTIVQKLVGLLVLLGLAGLVWYQRDSLQDCADRVRTQVTASSGSVTCTILGQDVDVPHARR